VNPVGFYYKNVSLQGSFLLFNDYETITLVTVRWYCYRLTTFMAHSSPVINYLPCKATPVKFEISLIGKGFGYFHDAWGNNNNNSNSKNNNNNNNIWTILYCLP
jgi:hypothetical protein